MYPVQTVRLLRHDLLRDYFLPLCEGRGVLGVSDLPCKEVHWLCLILYHCTSGNDTFKSPTSRTKTNPSRLIGSFPSTTTWSELPVVFILLASTYTSLVSLRSWSYLLPGPFPYVPSWCPVSFSSFGGQWYVPGRVGESRHTGTYLDLKP